MTSRLRLAALTTGRQDWGILRSTCRLLASDAAFELALAAGGMALSAKHGRVVEMIRDEGFAPAEVSWDVDEPCKELEAAAALARVGDWLRQCAPDAMLLVGDRHETLSAALACTLLQIPIVHFHGGEETEGAVDNAIRHAITKLSHLHFVSHETHAARVRAMGEDPSAVHVVGAPGLDNVHRDDLPSRAELEARVGIPLRSPVVVTTLHPTTLGTSPEVEARAVREAMQLVPATYVITLPNSDAGADITRAAMEDAAKVVGGVAIEALGERFYWALLRSADAMLGNSSSALVEAPAVGLPAVNVGDRQRGRLRAPNVIDVRVDAAAIADALRRAVDPDFRASIADSSRMVFGDGHSAERIVEVLCEWQPPRPPKKKWWPARGE